MENYEKMKRAEDRLSRNLNSSFWAFATFTGFHLGFIYVATKELKTLLPISSIVIGLIVITGGTVLHFASVMSMNTYRTNIKANEKVISDLETEFKDFQQKNESERPKTHISGAGKARKLIFYFLWLTEIALGLYYIFSK